MFTQLKSPNVLSLKQLTKPLGGGVGGEIMLDFFFFLGGKLEILLM